MGLVIEFSLAVEFTDETFSTEEATDKAAAGFTDVKFQCVFEGDDMSGVDGVIAIDFDAVDSAVATEEQVTVSGAFHPEHRFAGKECGGEALPSGIDIDTWGGSEPAGGLYDHGSAAHGMVCTIAEHGRTDEECLFRGLGGEVVQEEAFAGEETFESFDDSAGTFSAFGGRFNGEVGGHGDHSPDFACQCFTLIEFELHGGGSGLA